jgi:hypothetical protein
MSVVREFVKRLIGSEIDAAVGTFKIQTAIAYLNLIKGTRRLTIILCLLVLSFVVLACGFLLVPVALCLFMPWTAETKTIVAASFGAAYIVIPLIAVMALFSEKRWMKATRADALLKSALEQ